MITALLMVTVSVGTWASAGAALRSTGVAAIARTKSIRRI